MTPLPDCDHVARYCPKKKMTEDGRITGAAFQLRESDKGSLSTNWLERLKLASRTEEKNALSEIYKSKMRKIETGSRIAILNVSNTKTFVQKESPDNRVLEFIHEPTHDDSHAAIKNIRLEEQIVPDLIADSIVDQHIFV